MIFTRFKRKRVLIITSGLLIALAITTVSFISVRGMLPFIPIDGMSMYPTLESGGLVTVEYVWPHNIQKGDIIVFAVSPSIQKDYGYNPVIARRVAGVNQLESYGAVSPEKAIIDVIPAENYAAVYYTSGDHSGEDPFEVQPRDVKGKVNKYYTGFGFPLLFFQSKQGLAVVIIALILLVVFLYWNELIPRLKNIRKHVVSPSTVENAEWAKYYKPTPAPRKIADRVFGTLIFRNQQQARRLETVQITLKQFANSITEYSEILRDHTKVIQQLSETTHDLKRSTEEYNATQKHFIELLEPALIVRQDKQYEYKEVQPETTVSPEMPITKFPPGCYHSRHQWLEQNQAV